LVRYSSGAVQVSAPQSSCSSHIHSMGCGPNRGAGAGGQDSLGPGLIGAEHEALLWLEHSPGAASPGGAGMASRADKVGLADECYHASAWVSQEPASFPGGIDLV
jgi:hypothetical protein